MLYSIIPPVLVVLSAIGIIIFLVKKSPAMAMMEKEEKAKRDSSGLNIDVMAKSVFWKNFKHKSLVVLEFVMRRLRVIFLKLEKKVTFWSESLKKKRGEKLATKENPEALSDNQSNKSSGIQNSTMEKLDRYEGAYSPGRRRGAAISEEDKKLRPMVSERVVIPQKRRVETKERFEEIMIERIAANPRDTEAYERLGEYYLEIENYDHAKECFKQVIKLDPTNRSVKYKIRKLEQILG